MSDTKHIHVIGIGGSAMAPLAGMLRERAFRVTGSDSGVYPPASTLLESLGISFFNTFDAAHLQPVPDLVVVGNVIARGNPELEEVLDRKIPYRSMPEILEEEFLPGHHSIVVSGTHGKTTTRRCLRGFFKRPERSPTFSLAASRKISARAMAWEEGGNSSSKEMSTRPPSGTAGQSFFTTIQTI
jgi:UDP-N-acetylmuramate: L-alanyl-gamma-D-glutamyl-meso-diaminopimelate ligase